MPRHCAIPALAQIRGEIELIKRSQHELAAHVLKSQDALRLSLDLLERPIYRPMWSGRDGENVPPARAGDP